MEYKVAFKIRFSRKKIPDLKAPMTKSQKPNGLYNIKPQRLLAAGLGIWCLDFLLVQRQLVESPRSVCFWVIDHWRFVFQTAVSPLSFATFISNASASSLSFLISPSRIASLMVSFSSPMILLGGRLNMVMISSPVIGGWKFLT